MKLMFLKFKQLIEGFTPRFVVSQEKQQSLNKTFMLQPTMQPDAVLYYMRLFFIGFLRVSTCPFTLTVLTFIIDLKSVLISFGEDIYE